MHDARTLRPGIAPIEDGQVIFCFAVELGAQMSGLGSINARKVMKVLLHAATLRRGTCTCS